MSVSEYLHKKVPSISLGYFRILFGVIIFYDTCRYGIKHSQIEKNYNYGFTYELTSFIHTLSWQAMNCYFVVMAAAAACVAVGLYYRMASILFCALFGCFFLMDQTRYLNHHYAICLIAFLMSLTKAGSYASLDRVFAAKRTSSWVPYWNVLIIRGQIAIIYFFGGIAKMNKDWLSGQPIVEWMSRRTDHPVVGGLFGEEWFVLPFFAYGGLIIDLLAPFLLFCKKTRWIGIGITIPFHLANAWIFSIGVFPWFMIAATLIFVDFKPRKQEKMMAGARRLRLECLVTSFVLVYFIIQALLPLRHWMYPGNVSWTEEGHRFSWHMKLRSKRSVIFFLVKDKEKNLYYLLHAQAELTARQAKKMSTRPHMIVAYANHLKEELFKHGYRDIEVRCVCLSSLNGRPYQLLVNPKIDLGDEKSGLLGHADWIVPLKKGQPIGLYDNPTEGDLKTNLEDDIYEAIKSARIISHKKL